MRRTVHPEAPVRIEYDLTAQDNRLRPASNSCASSGRG
ncbi:hypothetical protein [Burkholderia territorii]